MLSTWPFVCAGSIIKGNEITFSRMTDTRRKLEEAEYFFKQMKESIEDDKIFSYNLSAFVTAARSISLFM